MIYVFFVEMNALRYETEGRNQSVEVEILDFKKTFEKYNYRIFHVEKANGGQLENYKLWIKLLGACNIIPNEAAES